MTNYFKPFEIILKHDLMKLPPEERKKVIEFLLEMLYPDWDKILKRRRQYLIKCNDCHKTLDENGRYIVNKKMWYCVNCAYHRGWIGE